jgi:hypothetical protein
MNNQEKTLAVMVKENSYSYKDFEGIIPLVNY